MLVCKVVGNIGAMLTLTGYVLMYLAVSVEGGVDAFWFCLISFIMGHGAIWLVIPGRLCRGAISGVVLEHV